MSAPSVDIRRVFEAGERVFVEGQPGDNAYIIERGRIEIAFTRSGHEVRVAALGPGEIFGEMALIDSRPRSATATAATATEVVVVRPEQIQVALRNADPTVRLLLQVLLGRFRAMQGRVEAINAEVTGAPGDARSSADQTLALDRLKLQREVQKAVEAGAFRLELQPIVSLSTGEVAGFEALTRWDHAERGPVSPAEFIHLAEEAEIIQGIDLWVCSRVLEILKQMIERDPKSSGSGLYIAINLSGLSLTDDATMTQIADMVRAAHLPAGMFRIEVTEGAVISDPRKVALVLEELAVSGVRTAIDDFGTGYSGLAYLVGFAIHTLKVDRVFVANMMVNQTSLELVRAIIGMAHALKMQVVAEGIETLDQLRALWRMQCELGQGYLFSTSLSPDEAIAFANRGPVISTEPIIIPYSGG